MIPVHVGTANVVIHIPASDNYKEATATCEITVVSRPVTVTAKPQTVLQGRNILQGAGWATLAGEISGHTLAEITLTQSTKNLGTGSIVPSAAKIKSGEIDVTVNYDITYVNGELTVVPVPLNDASITATLDTLSYVYDETAHEPTATITDSVKNYTLIQDKDYTIRYEGNVCVGTATALITGSGDYTGTIERTFTIVKAPRHIFLDGTYSVEYREVDVISFSYDGEPVAPTAVSSNACVEVLSTSNNVITIKGCSVGSAVITLTVPASDNYNSQTAQVTVTVTQRSANHFEISLSQDEFTYDGHEKTPAVTVTDEGDVLSANRDYEVYYEDNIDATTEAKVIVVGINNYAGDKTVTFIINRATRTIQVDRTRNTVYGNELRIPFTYDGEDETASGDVGNSDVIRIMAYTDGVRSGEFVIDPLKNGSGELTITVPQSRNYKKATAKVLITVARAAANLAVDQDSLVFTYGDNSLAVNATTNSNGLVDANTSNINVAGVSVSNKVITIVPKNAGTAEITVFVPETEQYFADSVTISVTVNPRPVTLRWPSEVEFIYSGSEHSITATVDNKVGSDSVSVNAYTNNVKINAGNYIAVATGLDNPNYTLVGGQNISKAWRILKANRRITLDPTAVTTEFGTNATVAMSYNGDPITNADITIVSNNESIATVTHGNLVGGGNITIVPVACGNTKVVVTIGETANYKETSGEIAVTIKRNSTEKITVAESNENVVFTYGDAAKAVEYFYAGNGEVSGEVSVPDIVDIELTANDTITLTPVNSGTTVVTLTTTQTDQYEASSCEIHVTVNAKPVELVWTQDEFTYTGEEYSITATVNNAIGTDVVSVTGYTNNVKTNAGEYTATATTLNNPNYTLVGGVNVSKVWRINKASITPVITMQDYTYGGVKKEPSISGNTDNGDVNYFVYQGDNKVSAINWNTVTSSTFLAPGEYKMFAVVSPTANYNGAESNTVTFHIAIAKLQVTITSNGANYTGAWTNQDVVVTATRPANSTTMTNVYYRLEGETNYHSLADTIVNGDTYTLTFSSNINSKVYFVGVDNSGKGVTESTDGDMIRIDKSKPLIGELTQTPVGKANSKIITASDVVDVYQSGVYGYFVTTNASVAQSAMTWTPFEGDFFNFSVSENATYYVYVVDHAGNISDRTANTTITVNNIVDKVSHAALQDGLVVEVYGNITPILTYSGEPREITFSVADSTIASIEPNTGLITGRESGETTITATLVDYDGTVTTLTAELTVVPKTPSLSISNPDGFAFIYGDLSKEITINYNGDGAIHIETTDETIVTATLNGATITASPLKVGTTTIVITTEATVHYKAATLEVDVVVTQRPVAIRWEGGPFEYDGNEKEVTATVANLVSGDEMTLTLANNTATAAGNYVASVTAIDNANYTLVGGTNITYSWRITKAHRTIDLPETATATYGENTNITFTYTGGDEEVTVRGNNPSVADIVYIDGDDGGIISVVPVSAGSVTVTVTIPENANYESLTATCLVTVEAGDAHIIFANDTITMNYGSDPVTVTYTYDGNSTRKNVVVSDNAVIDAVLQNDQIIVTPKAAGTATVTLVAASTSQFNECEASFTVIVTPRPVSLAWSADEFDYDGSEKSVSATINNIIDGDEVTLTYSGEKATNAGNYVAIVTGIDNVNYTLEGGTNLTHEWTIHRINRTLNVPNAVTLKYGEETTVSFGYIGDIAEVTASNRKPAVMEVTIENEANGGSVTIRGLSAGSGFVVLTLPETTNYIETTAIINVMVEPTSPEFSVEMTAPQFVYGDDPKVIGFINKGDGQVHAESTNENVAEGLVSGDKVIITPNNAGTAQITLYTDETSYYASERVIMTVTIAPKPVELVWRTRAFLYDGHEKTMSATVGNALPGDSVEVSSYTDHKATNVGQYTARATALSNPNYTLENATNVSAVWVIRNMIPAEIVIKQGGEEIADGTWATGDITVEVKQEAFEEYNPVYEYSFNNKDWVEFTDPIGFNEETNGTTIYARVTDKDTGTPLSIVAQREIKIDKTSPVISISSVTVSDSDSTIVNKDSIITITIAVTDNGAGINPNDFDLDDIKLLISDKGTTSEITGIQKRLVQAAANANLENGKYIYTLTISGVEGDGRISIRVPEKSVTDNAGNYNKQMTENLDILVDNVGPNIGIIETNADEYNRVYGNEVNLRVTATDPSGISTYIWQVSENGRSWTTFEEDKTEVTYSFVKYMAQRSGAKYFRVIVRDTLGNESTSEVKEVDTIATINRKPTIRFETEQNTNRKVTIIGIIKSTYDIKSINVNASDIDAADWKIDKYNNEITVTARYDVNENGLYKWYVEDTAGNIVTGECNITSIDDTPATLKYNIYDATEYSKARIEFNSTQDVRITKVILPDGTTKNIVRGDEVTGLNFSTTDFNHTMVVTINSDSFERGTVFVFENKAFLETSVEILNDISTNVRYIRSVSVPGNLFDRIFSNGFTLENARAFVRKMITQTKEVDGKVVNYYGVSSSMIEAKVAGKAELDAATILSESIKNGAVLKMNKMGEVQGVQTRLATGIKLRGTTYLNGTITGIQTFGPNVINNDGNEAKTTFRIILQAK